MVSLGGAHTAAHVARRQRAPAFVTANRARCGVIALASRAKKLDSIQRRSRLDVQGYSGLVFTHVFATAATALALYMAIQGDIQQGFQDLKGDIADLKADITDMKTDIRANSGRLDNLNASFGRKWRD